MTNKRCPWWEQDILPFRAPLKFPDWEIPETKQFQSSSNFWGCEMGKKRNKVPHTAQAVGINKDKIFENLVKKLQQPSWDITE